MSNKILIRTYNFKNYFTHAILNLLVLIKFYASYGSHSPFPFLVCVLSRFGPIQLFETPWTIAWQAPLSLGLSRREYWSGLLYPPARDLPDPGSNPGLLHLLHCRRILYPLNHLDGPFLLLVCLGIWILDGKNLFGFLLVDCISLNCI